MKRNSRGVVPRMTFSNAKKSAFKVVWQIVQFIFIKKKKEKKMIEANCELGTMNEFPQSTAIAYV